MSDLLAARSQMAMSLAFHIIFAAIGIALPLLMVIAEWRWLRTREQVYLTLAERWAKGTAILFAVGYLGLGWDCALAQETKKVTNLVEGISSPDFGYLPSYLARAKGFLAKEGVDLKIVVMRANVSVPALVSGDV